jgi:tetratricopeptide (TPR) repeat protein
VRYDSRGWQGVNNRGVSYAMMGRLPEAADDFDRVIELKPDFAPAWFNRGELRQQQGQLAEAIEDYDRALELRPGDRAALVSRGQAYFGLGKNALALADFGEAIRVDPKHSAAYIHRGTTLVEVGRYAEAARDFKAAIRIDVQNPAAYQAAAWMMSTCPDPQFRDPRLAVPTAQKAIELNDGQDYRYQETLAAAYAAAGQFERAVATQKKVVAMIAAESPELAAAMRQRQSQYERRQAYRVGQGTSAAVRTTRSSR